MSFLPAIFAVIVMVAASLLNDGVATADAMRYGGGLQSLRGNGLMMVGKLIALVVLTPYLRPIILWGLGQSGVGGNVSPASSPAGMAIGAVADVASNLVHAAGGVIGKAVGQIEQRVEQRAEPFITKIENKILPADHGDLCSILMSSLGGPDYVEVTSHKAGKIDHRVFGSPPAVAVEQVTAQAVQAVAQTPVAVVPAASPVLVAVQPAPAPGATA